MSWYGAPTEGALPGHGNVLDRPWQTPITSSRRSCIIVNKRLSWNCLRGYHASPAFTEYARSPGSFFGKLEREAITGLCRSFCICVKPATVIDWYFPFHQQFNL